MNLDNIVSRFFLENLHGSDFVNRVMIIFSKLGSGGTIWIIFLLTILIVQLCRNKKFSMTIVFALVILLIGWLFNDYFLKIIINRSRPYTEIGGFTDFMVSMNYPFPSGSSFPSGHSFSSFSAATMIFLYRRKLGLISFPLAFAIAFSRIFVGAHYLSDVLTGSFLGASFGCIHFLICQQIFSKTHLGDLKYASR